MAQWKTGLITPPTNKLTGPKPCLRRSYDAGGRTTGSAASHGRRPGVRGTRHVALAAGVVLDMLTAETAKLRTRQQLREGDHRPRPLEAADRRRADMKYFCDSP
jgi:hypothetical protein